MQTIACTFIDYYYLRPQIYQNAELQALISALGLGVRGIEFDAEQLRYHKVIIMTGTEVHFLCLC